MRTRLLIATWLLAASTHVMADEPGYRLSMESSLRENRLTVAPRIVAPAGANLRYEIVSTRLGAAGKSNTSQSGRVAVGPDGTAALSTLRVSVEPQDRCEISIRVFDGKKIVAEKRATYPE